ncbi:CinA family protein [Glaciecola sp. 1036]|uniref:CinA family protein n=1 Tax=Alteromonadaceae TaxID=72275 RepID=UPI003D061155
MLNNQLEKKLQLSEDLGRRLIEKNAFVTTIESCTGGGLAYAITEVPGSSAYIKQSWVTYSNEAKMSLVGVKAKTLDRYGAVSKDTVVEMANGGLLRSAADYAVAISGIAGPTGGSAHKPVGLVWFAIATKSTTVSFNRKFSGDRHLVREQAIVLAIEKLIDCIVQEPN